jgi:hypothetical protein
VIHCASSVVGQILQSTFELRPENPGSRRRRHMTKLPPDVFEAVVRALADALVADYRSRWNIPPTAEVVSSLPAAIPSDSAWLTVQEAARRARCGVRALYRNGAIELHLRSRKSLSYLR